MPTLPTVNVTVNVVDAAGEPVYGAAIVFRLNRLATVSGFAVPTNVTALTDAAGVAVAPLCPNALCGGSYAVRISASGIDSRGVAYIPNEDCLLDSVFQSVPYPEQTYVEAALVEVSNVQTLATAAAASATTATTQAGLATTAAGTATAQVGLATTAAETATTKAIEATGFASSARGYSLDAAAARDTAVATVASVNLPTITVADAGKYLQVNLAGDGYVASEVSGADKWTAETAFTATPASTSTLTMTADKTADIKPGMPLRYTIGGTAYYGICTAITSGLLTVAGAPLSGSVTALAYSIFPGMVESVQIFVANYWADTADTSLIVNDLVSPWVWSKPPAALVQIKAYTRTTDTGASFPRINARIGSTTTDYVSTSNSNAGLSLAASATWYSTVVDIGVAKYTVTAGQTVELKTDANGGNDNAADLSVVLVFVYA